MHVDHKIVQEDSIEGRCLQNHYSNFSKLVGVGEVVRDSSLSYIRTRYSSRDPVDLSLGSKICLGRRNSLRDAWYGMNEGVLLVLVMTVRKQQHNEGGSKTSSMIIKIARSLELANSPGMSLPAAPSRTRTFALAKQLSAEPVQPAAIPQRCIAWDLHREDVSKEEKKRQRSNQFVPKIVGGGEYAACQRYSKRASVLELLRWQHLRHILGAFIAITEST